MFGVPNPSGTYINSTKPRKLRAFIGDLLCATPFTGNLEQLRSRLKKLVYIRVTILTILLGITGLTAWSMYTEGAPVNTLFLWSIAFTYLISMVNLLLLRHSSNLVTVGYLQLTVDIILSTLAIGMLHATGTLFLYLLIIIGASTLFSSHGAIRIAMLCGLSYGIVATGIVPLIDGTTFSVQPHEFLIVYMALIVVALISGVTAKQFELVGKTADKYAKHINELTLRHNQMFEDLTEGIITLDVDNAITSINQAALAIVGLADLDSDELVGQSLPALFKEKQISGAEQLVNKNCEAEKRAELCIGSEGDKGNTCVRYVSRKLESAIGEFSGQMIIFDDISHVKQIEERLSLHEQMTQLLSGEHTTQQSSDIIRPSFPIIGESQVMTQVYNLVERVAKSEASVLITGESGTGKELIAKAIHNSSNRSNNNFVAINCGAIPEHLIESELFGHKKGAFTGAVRDYPGLFREAEGGTLFLDEVGELPLHLQAKLLRALQEKQVRPVGDTRNIEVDVRIIAATNRNLRKESEKGNFREDLFYRLNVVNIPLPALRQRKEDIPLLVRHFISNLSDPKQPLPNISSQALQLLMKYSYPGNVRELENIIERALVLGGSAILPEHLPQDITREAGNSPETDINLEQKVKNAQTELLVLPIDLEKELAKMEQTYLRQALKQASGTKKQAAELLGLNFRSFRYRLKKYNIAD